jgi:hypothetical protein
VIGRCMQRHRHSEFIRFLNAVEREVPAGKLIQRPVEHAEGGKPTAAPTMSSTLPIPYA